jgi:hypothetical protein
MGYNVIRVSVAVAVLARRSESTLKETLMPTTQHATTNVAVLDAVRRLVDDEDRRSHSRRAVAVLRAIAAQKAANHSDGVETPIEDNWALLLAAVDRGDL